ncbi:MAG: phosphatase [Bacteroidia bacterium]
MRFAIIDTGTNTFHLLIVERTETGFKEIYKTQEGVKLGESGISDNVISEQAFERGINTFKEFKHQCDIHNTTKIVAIGTAALRNASNANELVQKVKDETGIEMIIISGNLEAELIWNGVRHAMNLGAETSLIMDIGGGSVEFIIADENHIYWKSSFDIGGALLLEKFKPADPVSNDDINNLKTLFEKELKWMMQVCGIFKPVQLIGSAGSFDTFTEMIVHQFYNIDDIKNTTEYKFNLADYNAIHQQLITSTHAQRLEMKGMLAMRADMIVVASILLNFVLRKLNFKEIKSSTYALKEGILYKSLSILN